jgi:hypothetical protein
MGLYIIVAEPEQESHVAASFQWNQSRNVMLLWLRLTQ